MGQVPQKLGVPFDQNVEFDKMEVLENSKMLFLNEPWKNVFSSLIKTSFVWMLVSLVLWVPQKLGVGAPNIGVGPKN